MKKIILILMGALFILTGCAKSNPSAEELKALYTENSDLSKDIEEVIVYTENTDPEGLLGKEHQYVEKIGMEDKRYLSDDAADLVIEVFNNTQDAEIRHDYYSLVNECRKSFAEREGLIIDGKSSLPEYHLFLHGNIVMRAAGSVRKNAADAYFKVLEQLLSDGRYRQTLTVNDEEYQALHKSMVEDQKSEIEEEIQKKAKAVGDSADITVAAALNMFEKKPDDSNLENAEKLIDETYKGKFFDSLRSEWQKRLDELKEVKEKNEAEYQKTADQINALLAESEADPDMEKYNACVTAVSEVPDNYWFRKLEPEWNSRLKALKNAAVLAERDRNAADITEQIKKLESSLDTSLYDELVERLSHVRNESLYAEYVDGWLEQMNALKEKIEEKKHVEEIQAFKDSCKSIEYREFSRNSESYKGTHVYFKGEVIQVVDQDAKGAELRVNVTAEGTYYTYYTDTIYVAYDNSDEINVSKILEDDIIEIWGIAAGDYSYTSIFGSKITLPAVYAKYIRVTD